MWSDRRSSAGTSFAGVLPLGLSMLWEKVDPELALADRFGFDGLGSVTAWVSTVLDATWGISVAGCSRVAISGPNAIVWVASDRGDLVVKWSAAFWSFAGLDTSTRLLRPLAAQGVPVAPPIATVDGRDRVVLDGPAGALSVTVLPELTGDWLDVADASAVRSAGACLAHVHRALGTSGDEVAQAVPRPEALTARIGSWLAAGDPGAAPEASGRLAGLLSAAPELDDEPQVVHNDYRAANIVTRGSTVVGVLDFDDVVVDHRVSDLAKASIYLGTRFTDWRPTPVAARDALRAGYESVRPLRPLEAQWLEILVLWHAILAIPGSHDPVAWAAAV